MSVLAPEILKVEPRTGVLIGGRWNTGEHGVFDVDDPADGTVLAVVADAGVGQAVLAVDAAQAAAAAWAETSSRHRSEVLQRAFNAMRNDVDALARLISAENGKSLSDARAEVLYAAEYFRWYAEEAVRTGGDYGPSPAGGVRTVVTHRPVGIAALVTPWNFPAAMATRKLGPALAAGCTTVLKPAAETPLTALAIASLLSSAGVPDGVVNVLPTTRPAEVVGAWLQDRRVRKLSFTGSTAVGRVLLKQAADQVVNASMELGGNAPFIVTEDTDVDDAVDGAMLAKFRGGGQACTAANRFYVHASVHDQFVDRFADRVRRLVVGRGTDPRTNVGPLISGRAVVATEALVEDALSRGARVAARAETTGSPPGHFFAPTVLVDVPNDALCVQQEIFAPVAPVVRWTSADDLLAMVNGNDMGLAAYIYCRDLKRALQLAEQVEAGMVALNRGLLSDPAAPFGGVKQSGLGREGAREGLLDYQETQYFSVDWS